MPDPITVGVLVAGALSLGGEAVKAGVVGEAVEDAYNALKARVAIWAAGDVAELDKTPNSEPRKAVIAEVVNNLPAKDQDELRGLAQVLTTRLKEAAPEIGLDIGRLDALAVELGKITVTEGIGALIQEAHVDGTFRARDISVGSPSGNEAGSQRAEEERQAEEEARRAAAAAARRAEEEARRAPVAAGRRAEEEARRAAAAAARRAEEHRSARSAEPRKQGRPRRSGHGASAVEQHRMGLILWTLPKRMRVGQRERIEVRLGDAGVAEESASGGPEGPGFSGN